MQQLAGKGLDRPIYEGEKTISVNTVTLKSALTVFVDKWVITYGIAAYLLTDYGLPFLSTFFASVAGHLTIAHFATTA